MATAQDQAGLPPKFDELSFRAQWAALAIRSNLGSIQKNAPAVPTKNADIDHLFPTKESLFVDTHKVQKLRVGIIGAGVAGLFTAMIFDHLKREYGLNVDYEILEASNRVGGRLYSHYFEATGDQPSIGPHDYYDVGAMRFPDIEIMNKTFELFRVLKMEKTPKDQPPKEKGALVRYYLNGLNQPTLYNHVQVVTTDLKKQKTARDFKITGIPEALMDKGVNDLIEITIQKYKDIYYRDKVNGPKEFWDELMKEADQYSVRQYLTKIAKYNHNTIEFLETLNYGNRWYDQALSEMILESMDFDTNAKPNPDPIPDPDPDPTDPKPWWWCVEGGTEEIAKRMQKELENQQAVELGKTVMAISYANDQRDRVDVSVKGENIPRTYDSVFNSAPLGAMHRMQLEGLKLNWDTKSAIRSLGYGASCKVGVRFRSLWWKKHLNIKKGGQGKTDLPIRCCVYPSYNIHDSDTEAGVLLVSYTWSQEAERIGALINRDSPAGEDELKEVLFHDLARLHAKTDDEEDYRRLHSIISDAYLSHHAFNWYSNPHSVGAFAYFGPGQFKNMYPAITGDIGRHIIIGEAASAHHAWVVGALESAVRGVYRFLLAHATSDKAASEALKAYDRGQVEEPFGPLPAEYDRTADIELPENPQDKKELNNLPPPIGDLARLQAVFESIRLDQGYDKIQPKLITKEQVEDINFVGL